MQSCFTECRSTAETIMQRCAGTRSFRDLCLTDFCVSVVKNVFSFFLFPHRAGKRHDAKLHEPRAEEMCPLSALFEQPHSFLLSMLLF